MAEQWPPDTLPYYISGRREFDNMTASKIYAELLKRRKINATVPLKEVSDACIEAKRLFELYLR